MEDGMENNNEQATEITPKNTKNEIFEAYQNLLNKVRETKQTSQQEIFKKKEDDQIVAKASDLNVAGIISKLSDIKLSVTKNLDQLEQKLLDEYRCLSDLQKAITIEKTNLQELYGIKKNADSLAVLLLAQKEYSTNFEMEMDQRKNKFEQEMTEKKAAWKKEQEIMQREKDEYQGQLTKGRQREEENYNYDLNLERKKDQDNYAMRKEVLEKELTEKKLALQKEFSEREALIKSQEEEYKNLKAKVELFPKELENSIRTAEKNTKEMLERNYKFQIDLSAKEIEGERKLSLQTIATLQAKINEQEAFIQQLTKKANDANTQVQTIAIKAIESTTGIGARYYTSQEESKKGQQSSSSV